MLASSLTAIASASSAKRERLAVEVAVREIISVLGEDERVVGGGVQLDRSGAPDVVEQVAAAPCTCGAQRSEYASWTRSHQRCDSLIARALEQAEDVRGRVGLARDGPQRVDWAGSGARTLECLDGEGAATSAADTSRRGAHQRERGEGAPWTACR